MRRPRPGSRARSCSRHPLPRPGSQHSLSGQEESFGQDGQGHREHQPDQDGDLREQVPEAGQHEESKSTVPDERRHRDQSDRGHGGQADPGHDHREGQGDLHPPQELPVVVPHASGRFLDVRGDAVETDHGVPDQDQERVAHQPDLRRVRPQPGERQEEGEQGQAGDRVQDAGHRRDRPVQAAVTVDVDRDRKCDEKPDGHGQEGERDVLPQLPGEQIEVGARPLPVEELVHEGTRISREMRSSVRMPRYRSFRSATTATLVREATIESSAFRSESAGVTYAPNLRGEASSARSLPSSMGSSTHPRMTRSSMTATQPKPVSFIIRRASSAGVAGPTTGPSSNLMSDTVIRARRFSPRSGPTKSSTNALAGARRISSGGPYCSRIPPMLRMAIRSARTIASSMSWVTNTIVFRSLRWRPTSWSWSLARTIGSTAANGSSISITGGSAATPPGTPPPSGWAPGR